MTHRTVREEAVSFAIGYLAGLSALLAWPRGGLLLGFGVAIAAGLTFDWIAYRRAPSLQARPWRYSVPAALAYVGTFFVWDATKALGEPGAAFATYVACVPLLATGLVASDWLWVNAADRAERERPKQ